MPLILSEKGRACIPRYNNSFGRLPSNMCAANCANCIITLPTNCGYKLWSILWPAEICYIWQGLSQTLTSSTTGLACFLPQFQPLWRIYDEHHFHTVSVSTQNALENTKEKLLTFQWQCCHCHRRFLKQSRTKYWKWKWTPCTWNPNTLYAAPEGGGYLPDCPQFSHHFHIT